MTGPDEHTAADFHDVDKDDLRLESVDLSRSAFTTNLRIAAEAARDFARTLVSNILPDEIAYTIFFGCSYDGNPLEEDEKTFPEDYADSPRTVTTAEEATNLLWRDGFVPEWINVLVSREDGEQTFVRLECCGRYSALPKMMYHVYEGRPPFHVLGPCMPLEFDCNSGAKFDLYWKTGK